MSLLLIYLLKLSLAIGLFYCFYQWLLRPMTFHRWNRYYLCGYGLLSLVIPFINIEFLVKDDGNAGLINSLPSVNNVDLSSLSSATPNRYWLMDSFPLVLGLIFSAGVVIMLWRLTKQYRAVLSIKKQGVLFASEEIKLYDVPADISPFSFNKAIYFNSRLHHPEELAKILQHEFVHVKQNHIVDLAIAEILCVINWFNPFVWLLRKAIKQNLEFIADQQVLDSGMDVRQYQYLLLKVTSSTPLSLSNPFNISSLKKRIAMMNKLRTAKVHLLKFLFVLPLLALMLVAFRSSQAQRAKASLTKIKAPVIVADVSTNAVDTVPARSANSSRKPARASRSAHIYGKMPDGVEKVKVTQQVTVYRKDGTTEIYDMASDEEAKAYEKKYGAMMPPPPPMPPVPAVAPASSAPTPRLAPIKPDNAKPPVRPVPAVPAEPLAPPVQDNSGTSLRRAPKDRQPLIVLDGTALAAGSDLSVINPNSIKTITLLKDANGVNLYGEAATNGVIIIQTKDNYASSPKKNEVEGKIYLNDKEISKEELRLIPASSIKDVHVIEDKGGLEQNSKKDARVIKIVSQ